MAADHNFFLVNYGFLDFATQVQRAMELKRSRPADLQHCSVPDKQRKIHESGHVSAFNVVMLQLQATILTL